jgi:hypothetical protein
MAFFTYSCPDHGNFRVSLDKRVPLCQCPICEAESKPVLKMGTVRVVERLDNGAMIRRVERLHDVEEIMEERDRAHSGASDADSEND